jgi:hypothetical protein
MDEINQTRLAELRAKRAASRTMDFERSVGVLKDKLDAMARKKAEDLVKRAKSTLMAYDFVVKRDDYSLNSNHNEFLWVELDVEVAADFGPNIPNAVLGPHHVRGLVHQILGDGWEVSRSRGDLWHLEFKYDTTL